MRGTKGSLKATPSVAIQNQTKIPKPDNLYKYNNPYYNSEDFEPAHAPMS